MLAACRESREEDREWREGERERGRGRGGGWELTFLRPPLERTDPMDSITLLPEKMDKTCRGVGFRV